MELTKKQKEMLSYFPNHNLEKHFQANYLCCGQKMDLAVNNRIGEKEVTFFCDICEKEIEIGRRLVKW